MTVYKPGEDSFLVAEQLEKLDLEGKKCLDMGTGSGFLAEKMLEQGARKVHAVDVNPEAVEKASGRLEGYEEAEVYRSDLFSEVDGKFDLIVFNPPYLPAEEQEIGDEEIWSGGEEGVEVLEEFLEAVENFLSEEGFAVFVASSLAEVGDYLDGFEVLDSENLWFEKLYVLRSE
jgi:release factor glutamine methyltransferase